MKIRIGYGYDVHAFSEEGPLILGGVTLPFERGLKGHSDADVLLHAISDALLGALALGDIGTHFPDTDPEWKGADSRGLLRAVVEKVRQRGWSVINLDSTVVAERPKLRPYIHEMRSVIAGLLEVEVSAISVKATTSERMGFAGREEGVIAHAVVLLGEWRQEGHGGDDS